MSNIDINQELRGLDTLLTGNAWEHIGNDTTGTNPEPVSNMLDYDIPIVPTAHATCQVKPAIAVITT